MDGAHPEAECLAEEVPVQEYRHRCSLHRDTFHIQVGPLAVIRSPAPQHQLLALDHKADGIVNDVMAWDSRNESEDGVNGRS